MIKTIKVSEHQINRAKELYPFNDLNGSITNGSSNIYGALGEILVCDEYNGIQKKTFDYDILINNYKIDVKSKKISNDLIPTFNWNATISNFNTRQKCDYYCFVYVCENLKIGFIAGFIGKEDYYNKASFNKKGETDINGSTKWNFRADCYNLTINNLKQRR